MDHQKAMTFFGVEVPDSLSGSIGELGHDVMTLAELQARLAQADMKESVREARLPAAGLVIGLVVLVSCVPIALVGLAELIVLADWLPRGGAYLAVAGGFALLSALLAWLSMRSLGRCGHAFQRSKGELSRNLSWIARVVSQSGTPRWSNPRW